MLIFCNDFSCWRCRELLRCDWRTFGRFFVIAFQFVFNFSECFWDFDIWEHPIFMQRGHLSFEKNEKRASLVRLNGLYKRTYEALFLIFSKLSLLGCTQVSSSFWPIFFSDKFQKHKKQNGMHLRKTFQKCGNRSGEASCSDSKKNQLKRLTCHDVTSIDIHHGHILGI